MRTFISLCSVWCLGVASLAAQEDTRVVKFRVLCYEHAKETTKAFVLGATGDKQQVEFLTGGFGPQLSGKFAGDKVRFYAENPGSDGKLVRSVVAEGTLGPSAVQMFLLLPESKAGGPIYRVLAFDDLEAAFPMGSTRVINLAPFAIRLNLAGKDLEPIKAGGMKVYPQVKAVDEWNMFSARIDFGVGADQWEPAATQSWKASDRKRDWVITHIDPASQTPAIRLYQDIPPWRETVLELGGAAKKTP